MQKYSFQNILILTKGYRDFNEENIMFRRLTLIVFWLSEPAEKKIRYEMNETTESSFIVIPKLALTILTSAILSISFANPDIKFAINAKTIVDSLGALMTALMAIIFAGRAGFTIIDKRKTMFFRWCGVIDQFIKAPLRGIGIN